MVLDQLDNAARYLPLHPAFAAAFAFLQETDLVRLAVGRYELQGDRLYVNVEQVEGRGREGARLEAHREYIDIQLALAAPDLIGWRALRVCTQACQPYDVAKDVAFFSDEPKAWIALPPGLFVLLFPEDAHAPLAAEGDLRKVIVKVAVDQAR